MREDFPTSFQSALLAFAPLFFFHALLASRNPVHQYKVKGHLVTRHVNVRWELRRVECFGETLNKRANVKNHKWELSRWQEDLVLIHPLRPGNLSQVWTPFSAFSRAT